MAKLKSLKDTYVKDEKYLFLGNGITQLNHPLSWKALLNDIRDKAKIKTEIGNKTNPLFFEELSFALDPKKTVEDNIHELKKMIADDALKLTPGEVHRQLIDKNYYQHFLTTNYDYCIEQTLDPTGKLLRHEDRRTSKYSLYRYNEIKGHHIWHIHGECDNGRKNNKEDSILIGFEHYGDYLQKIHRLIKRDSSQGLLELIQASRYNWVHKFFTHDIDMLGFGMNFNETHLWFILNFRARLIRKKIPIINKIRWFYSAHKEAENADTIDLLNMLEVEVVKIPSTSYAEHYELFLAKL